MPEDKYTQGTKNELLNRLNSSTDEPSLARDQMKTAIQVRCTEDIETAINTLRESNVEIANSNSKLGEKVFWLNLVITAATVIGIVIKLFEFCNKAPK